MPTKIKSMAGIGVLPAEVRLMTPATYSTYVQGYNAAHSNSDAPPTAEQYSEMVAKYA